MHIIFCMLGFFFLFLSFCGQFWINKGRQITLVAAMAAVLAALLLRGHSLWLLFPALALIHAALVFVDRWTGHTVAALLNLAAGCLLLISDLPALFQAEPFILKLLTVLLLLLLALMLSFVTYVTFCPAQVMRTVRDKLMKNGNTADAEQREEMLEEGVRRISDLRYDEKLPNGFLDVYLPVKEKARKLTVVYVHGGGYIWGDKASGDPNAGSNAFDASLPVQLSCAGYPVVSMNYALSPEYRYPMAIRQLSRGLHWLSQQGASYGLSMEHVVLAGASAGGNLAGVLANIETNPNYAEKMDIRPAFPVGTLKAMIFEGGLMDNRLFGVTHNALYDYVFYHMGRVYLSTNELIGNDALAPSNVIDNVTERFPPSFISDGNYATFYDQARALDKRLRELGVTTQLNIFPIEQAGKLVHGFEESGSEWGKKTTLLITAFLDALKLEGEERDG